MKPKLSLKDRETLTEVARIAKLETASFGLPSDGTITLTGMKQVDEFVKERIKIWARTWIHEPIAEMLQE